MICEVEHSWQEMGQKRVRNFHLTNVTDLRTLRYPTREQLIDMGKAVDFEEFNQECVDQIIERFL